MTAYPFSPTPVRICWRIILCLTFAVALLAPPGAAQSVAIGGLERDPQAITAWYQVTRLNPSAGRAGQAFGASAEIDGDVLVAGSYSDDYIPQFCPNCGSASVFIKTAGGWAGAPDVAKLTASDVASQDNFGTAVAISGDTIVVGSNPGCPGHLNCGAVYVFEKPPSGWITMTQTAKLTASDATGDEFFGSSVSISGNTIAVAADMADIGGNENQGAIYVFERPASGWITMTESAKLTASDGLAGDYLGVSVAIDEDTIVAGAHGHDNGAGIGSGKVYVFNKPFTGWVSGTESAQMTASDSSHHDFFGWSVDIDGDTIIAGAIGDDTGDLNDHGSAYVFQRTGSGWPSTEDGKLTASEPEFNDNFGSSVAILGETAAVGAYYDEIGGESKQGAVYVFNRGAGGWADMTEDQLLTADDGQDSDQLGQCVDMDTGLIVAGASRDDVDGATDLGSVYVFAALAETLQPLYLPVLVRGAEE